MIATLSLAAILLAQEPGPLDAILSRHADTIQKAKTYDDLVGAAKNTLAEIVKLLESGPDAESAARARAIASDICVDLGDFDGAEAHARKFLETWPKHAKAAQLKMSLGQIRSAAGRDASARNAYQAFIQDHPDDARVFEARVRIAQSFLCERRDDEAFKALVEIRAASKGKPEEWAAVLEQALARQIAGKPGEGRALLEEAVRSCPEPRIAGFAKLILANWLWIGKPAPPIEGSNLKGEALKLDPSGGKVTVVYFTFTAFRDFTVEAGVMRRLSRQFAAGSVSILAVAIDKDKAKLETELAKVGVTWPVIYDGNEFKGPIASACRLDNLPLVLVIDRKNVIRHVNPIFSDHGREIGRCVEQLLAEK